MLFAYNELSQWLGHPSPSATKGVAFAQDAQMVAAVSLGYPAEHPTLFSRKPLGDVTVWL